MPPAQADPSRAQLTCAIIHFRTSDQETTGARREPTSASRPLRAARRAPRGPLPLQRHRTRRLPGRPARMLPHQRADPCFKPTCATWTLPTRDIQTGELRAPGGCLPAQADPLPCTARRAPRGPLPLQDIEPRGELRSARRGCLPARADPLRAQPVRRGPASRRRTGRTGAPGGDAYQREQTRAQPTRRGPLAETSDQEELGAPGGRMPLPARADPHSVHSHDVRHVPSTSGHRNQMNYRAPGEDATSAGEPLPCTADVRQWTTLPRHPDQELQTPARMPTSAGEPLRAADVPRGPSAETSRPGTTGARRDACSASRPLRAQPTCATDPSHFKTSNQATERRRGCLPARADLRAQPDVRHVSPSTSRHRTRRNYGRPRDAYQREQTLRAQPTCAAWTLHFKTSNQENYGAPGSAYTSAEQTPLRAQPTCATWILPDVEPGELRAPARDAYQRRRPPTPMHSRRAPRGPLHFKTSDREAGASGMPTSGQTPPVAVTCATWTLPLRHQTRRTGRRCLPARADPSRALQPDVPPRDPSHFKTSNQRTTERPARMPVTDPLRAQPTCAVDPPLQRHRTRRNTGARQGYTSASRPPPVHSPTCATWTPPTSRHQTRRGTHGRPAADAYQREQTPPCTARRSPRGPSLQTSDGRLRAPGRDAYQREQTP
jgi:hypothetical protein